MYKEKVVGLLFRSDDNGSGHFVNVVQCSDAAICEKPWLAFDTDPVIPFSTVYGAV